MSFFKKLKLFSVASGVLFSLFCYGATVVDDDMDWLVPIIKAAVDKAKENAGGGGAGGGTSPVAQPWDLSVRPEPAPLPSGSATGFFVPATSQVSDILVAPINKGNTPGTITGSFYVDATGRANYSVPVKLPPGIRGLTPSLSISYSGSSANGLLGVGWSISGISSITRCAKTISQDGKIGIVSLSPDDALCMDGSRLLGVGTNEYKTEIESFKKIVSTSTMAGYPDSFTVTTKDGVVYKYGLDANSRLTASGASGKVLTWMVSSISDVDGNAIKFSYLKNAGNFPASTSTGALATEVVPDKIEYGGGTQPLTTVQFKYASGRADWDVNTVAGSRFWTTKLLDKIEVNNNASLVRQYELVYTKSGKGKDATEAGFNPSLLANIKECGIDANSNKLCTDATRFDWTEPAKASVAMGTSLEADQPVWRSLSNPSLTSDTASDVFYYAKDVAYSAQLDANGSIYYLHGLVSGYGGYVGTHSYYVNSSPISRFYPCVPSSGTATDAAFRPSSQISGFPRGVNDPVTLKNYLSLQDNGALYGCQKWGGSNDQPMLFYTANKAISSFTASSHAVVALNGSSFEYQLRNAQNVWTAAASISAPNSNIVQFSLVDSAYNGGATYLLAVDSNGNAWKRFLARSDNTGNCITSWCQIGPSGEKIRQLHPFYAQPGDTALYSYFGLMLLTQSGDLLLDKTDPIDVMTATKPSTGYEKLASNVSKVKISSEWVKDVSNGLSCSNLKIGVISNGGLFYLTDGKATISCGSTKPLLEQAKWRAEAGDVRDFDIDTGYITVIDSTGNLFIRTNIADGGTYKLIGKNVRSASIVNNSTGDKAATTRAIVVAGEVPEPFRLARIVDGLGKETSITYGTTNDSAVYTDNLPVFYPNSRLNGRMTVVKSVKQSDGLGGQVSDFYSYFNARVDQNGRGFLGFSQSKHTDPLGIETSSHYLQSFPYIGLNHYRTDIKGGITLRATSTDFRSVSQSADNKRYFVYPKTVQIATYDQDNNGALLSGEENSVNAIDAYGNVTEQKRTYTQYAVKDGAENNKVFESLTKTTYSNDSSAWLLGLPTSRIERRTNPDATVKYVANEYVYDTTKKHRVATLKQNGKVGDSWAITYDDSSKLFTSFVYDSVGNVSQQSVTGMAGKDANGVAVNQTRVTKTTWGNNGVYPTEVFHPVDMAKGRVSGEKREFDTRFGLMSKLTDRNGAATVTSYDTLGRPVSMTFPDGRSKTISYAACNSTLTPPANCAYQVTEQETGYYCPSPKNVKLAHRHLI